MSCIGINRGKVISKVELITFFTSIIPKCSSKKIKDFLGSKITLQFDELLEIVNKHKSLTQPFSLLQECIIKNVLKKDLYTSIYFRYHNKNDILTYFSLHNKYPPLPCKTQLLSACHIIVNPYSFDYYTTENEDINELSIHISKRMGTNRVKVNSSVEKLKRIGSTHTHPTLSNYSAEYNSMSYSYMHDSENHHSIAIIDHTEK